jgi:head-tail adaptor
MQTGSPPDAIGQLRDRVRFEAPLGAPVPDGDGGYTQSWTPLTPPTAYVRLRPASSAERAAPGTLLTHASYIVVGRFHPGVTTETRLIDADGRVYQVTSAINVENRGRDMHLIADLQG